MKSSIPVISLLVIFLVVAACGPAATEQITHTPVPTNTDVPPTHTPSPTLTSTSTNTPTASPTIPPTETPTATATEEPTATPTDTPTATATAVPQVSSSSNVIIKYLVLQGTGGPKGCGDSLVPVSTGFLRTGDIQEDVKIALNSLFSTGTKYSGTLYNPLYQSKLRVGNVDFKKSTGEVTIQLSGSFTKPKDDCDKLLYRAQVWDTVRQFPEVWRAYIGVNKYLLGDLLVVGDG